MGRRTAVFASFLGPLALLCWPAAGFGQEAASATPIGVLRFRLGIARMIPASLTVPAGTYLLVLQNGIVRGDVDFELDNPQATALATARIKKGSSQQNRQVVLTPGKHTLRVIGQPKWTSEIMVTPQ